MLGDDSTEDNDRSSDEDYHLSDEDKPRRPKHRGKPAWATKPIPKKKPEYAVDRKLNGLSQKDDSSKPSVSDTTKLNHNNSDSNTGSLSNNTKTPAQNGGTNSKSGPVVPPTVGSATQSTGGQGELSEEDIATLENVDDLVNYVVQDDA